MPVSGAFRSRREGKRRLRTFCGFPGRWRPAALGRSACRKTGRLGYRSVTHPESNAPGRTGLGRDAVLQRPPCCLHIATSVRSGSARSLRTTRSATSSAAPACSSWSSNGTWTTGQIVRPIRACGIRRPGDRYLLCSDRLSSVAEDRPHFFVRTFGRRIRRARRPAGRPSRVGSARLG